MKADKLKTTGQILLAGSKRESTKLPLAAVQSLRQSGRDQHLACSVFKLESIQEACFTCSDACQPFCLLTESLGPTDFHQQPSLESSAVTPDSRWGN